MITIDAAIEQLLLSANDYKIALTDTNVIHLTDALGRILATDITSEIDVPPANNSAMDGYAFNTESLEKNSKAFTSLHISQTIKAGHPPSPLEKNTAARIFTGAEIPLGANSVVMQEQCDTTESLHVKIPNTTLQNNNIRQQGQDIARGDVVLQKGRRLQAQDLGLLASVGIQQIAVLRPLTVAILSSGDELVEPGKKLHSGKIYNSNRYLLHGFLRQLGINVIDIGTVDDTLTATLAALEEAKKADCIITTGGVSVGDEDHIKQAVNQLGKIDFWRIALKPGKPVAFGSVEKTPFIGLPGNPASVFITFILLARPFLQQLRHETCKPSISVRLPANFSRPANPKRTEYLRARINNHRIEIHPNQSSGVLSSTIWAEGLAIIPPQTAITKGNDVEFLAFNGLF